MSFGESITTVFRKYADFGGTATRPEFWWFALFSALVSSALNVFNVIPVGAHSSLGAILSGLWGVAVIVPSLAVAVRRLRDTGRGWANIFFVLIPIAGIIILIVFWAEPSKVQPAA